MGWIPLLASYTYRLLHERTRCRTQFQKKKKKKVCPTEIIGLADLHAGYRPDMNFGSFARMTQNLLLVLRHRLNLSRSVFKFGFKVATVQYRERWRHNDPPPHPTAPPSATHLSTTLCNEWRSRHSNRSYEYLTLQIYSWDKDLPQDGSKSKQTPA